MTTHYTKLIYKLSTEVEKAFPDGTPEKLQETLDCMVLCLANERYAALEWLAEWIKDFLAI